MKKTSSVGTTTITDPQLNRQLDAMVPIWFRNSSRKGDRKTIAEALIREGIAALKAKGWFEDPDRVEGLVDAPADSHADAGDEASGKRLRIKGAA